MSTLTIERHANGVARVPMSRPDIFNAFDETMIGELDAAFATLAAAADVRTVVLAGEGRHFSAGVDLQWMQRASTAAVEWNLQDARRFATMLARIDTCPKPTVARVQGAVLGGGFGLVTGCDVAVAADNASFSVNEARFGSLPAVIGHHVVNAVGKRQARRLKLATTRITATEALAMGLVHGVAPLAEPDAAVDGVVRELLLGGPAAQADIKQLFARLEVGPVTADTREQTANTMARVRGSDKGREGVAAFMAKRPAAWAHPS